jgi:hypothetical protein
MRGQASSTILALIVLLVPCVVTAADAVVMEPGEGPPAGLEIKKAFDEFMRVNEECRGSGGDVMNCICDEGAALERLNTALASALEKHPDWRERPLQYRNFADDSTLQIVIPAMQEQMSMMTTRCG